MAQYMYSAEVRHDGLHKYQVVKAPSQYELTQKVDALKALWNEQYARKIEREAKLRSLEENQALAAELTEEAVEIQNALDTILTDHLNPSLTFPLEKDNSEFISNVPEWTPIYPNPPEALKIPREPMRTDYMFNPPPNFWTKLSKKKMTAFRKTNDEAYQKADNDWKVQADAIAEQNQKAMSQYNLEIETIEKKKAERQREEAKKRESFRQRQILQNQKAEELEARFHTGEPEVIERVFRFILENIDYPFPFNQSTDVEFDKDRDMLLLAILLPAPENLPCRKSVNYIKTHQELRETFFSDAYIKKKYENVVYQIVLLTLHTVFSISGQERWAEQIGAVALNGFISTTDKSTGKAISPCILSVAVDRASFDDINLYGVDPRAWFKSAKGVSAATLASITPVAPVMQFNREDHRFIDGYAVMDAVTEGDNLAAMDWQDFENLIRDLFEKEFSAGGGEVKITQASRDGGVDAVAFDPDPIRGGKIVIQAKCYTNTVDVSAVRDLYGTIMNEGAMKGILVTTSDYGNDAYVFAQGKPITLLNGANLLSLMEKHGHKARIDLQEAKRRAEA